MKKIIIYLLALALACALLPAAAENIVSYSENALADAGLSGDFEDLDDAGFRLFVPKDMHMAEVTDEQWAAGAMTSFVSDDGSKSIVVCFTDALDANGDETDEASEVLQTLLQAGADDAAEGVLNDMPCVFYTIDDTRCVAMVIDWGTQIVFEFSPASDPAFMNEINAIITSIMPM